MLCTSSSIAAQDQFGRAVAVSGGDVLVLKPFAGRGPATVFVYKNGGDGVWNLDERLRPVGGELTGENFSQSMAQSGAMVLVASADPNVRWGAHAFRRGADGGWEQSGKIDLALEVAADSAATLDLAGIMRILQPPRRVVAVNEDMAAVAVVGGPVATRGVRILQQEPGSDLWSERARLQPTETKTTNQLGAALAIEGDRVLVGAPRHGESGAVFVFAKDAATGEWSEEAIITRADSNTNSRFGTAVAFAGEVALVGAPATGEASGVVFLYTRDPNTGMWNERRRLAASQDAAGDRFGAALAVSGSELWVGAPGANERRGAVHRFLRDGDSATWIADGVLATGPEADFGVGSSLAVGRRVAVAGAPLADAGFGRVAVFSRTGEGGWAEPVWLSGGGTLDAVAGEEVKCDDGIAAGFTCDSVDLLAFLPIASLGGEPGERVSDVWGWTDPETKREYALVGRSGGMAIVDITNPTMPAYLGVVPANRSGARDLKIYHDHVFFTGDGAGAHGLIVFDLARLRTVENPPITFEPDAKYEEIASAHNLIIDTVAGFAYPVGASGGGQTCGGGLHMVDIRDPKNPTFAGCFTDTEGLIWAGRTHDGQCLVYDGPDEDYRGRQICFASNETALRIVDVTDKENPIPVSTVTYPGRSYVHQGWLTDDGRYFYLDDELDELVGEADRTRTLVLDVADLDDPVFVSEYFGADAAIDHNLFIKGDRMYQANYQAGLRVIDISDPLNPVEVGFFDTTPYEGNPPGFNGAWTAFPFFESGTVIVSSMNEGLFVLKPQRSELVP